MQWFEYQWDDHDGNQIGMNVGDTRTVSSAYILEYLVDGVVIVLLLCLVGLLNFMIL